MMTLWRMLVRAKRSILISFLIVAVLLLTLVALRPDKYESHMAFLIRNERADVLVSTDAHQNSVQHGEVTEEDLNSEVELLGSTELLQNVVKACGLDKEFRNGSGRGADAAVEQATRKLSKNLVVTPVRKSAIINVAYTSRDRAQSVEVLNELSRQYLAKHTNLHTASVAATFFRERSLSIAVQLLQAEKLRASTLQQYGLTLLPQERQLGLEQMFDVRKARNEAAANFDETESRLREVHQQQASSDPRIVTQARVEANQYSVERLNTMIAELENRRTELATKFLPGDPLLEQADKQLGDTRTALANAERISAQATTTDVNPIRQGLDSEENRLRETASGLQSRRADLNRQLTWQVGELGRMERASIVINEMDRNIKELEESLELYRSKALAASIGDDLDAAKISNVVVASAPIVPVLPAPSPFNYFTALLLALFLSLAVGLFPQLFAERNAGSFSPAEESSRTYVEEDILDRPKAFR